MRKRVNRLKYVNKIERSRNKLKMLSKQTELGFASTSSVAHRANGLSIEVFLAVASGHVSGCKPETVACDFGKVVVLSIETSVTAWSLCQQKADEERVMTVSLCC